ncbi:MAG: histidinol-phosphate aminotransferase family protein [Saprospiraceae bacterium]|nr:histidinol-phosphate aminotransferase family protein [Saprospiraceae bacterium]
MGSQEQIFSLLPRHIRKIVQAKIASPFVLPKTKDGFLNMDSTVSPFGTVGTDEMYNIVPDSETKTLKKELSAFSKTNSNQISIGNGSDELFDLLIRTFCNPHEDKILCFSTGNQRVIHHAKMNAVEVDELTLQGDFELPVFDIKRAITKETKVIFVENPNQITGKCFSNFDIIDLATGFDGIVVIDESAIDYAANKSLISMINLCSNVVIIQNFCRAWGLSGLPVGVAYAQPSIITILNLLKPPFSVNIMAQRMAIKAMYVTDQKDRIVQKTIEERAKVKAALEQLPNVNKVHDSETNTLLIEVINVAETIAYLRNEEQIYVFDASSISGLENCIRITIGLGIQNMRLVKALKNMPAKTSKGYIFWRKMGKTLRKASMYLGIFKKIFGAGS